MKELLLSWHALNCAVSQSPVRISILLVSFRNVSYLVVLYRLNWFITLAHKEAQILLNKCPFLMLSF